MNKIIDNIKYILLVLLIILIPISYHPAIMNISDMDHGTIFSKYIILLTIILFILSLKLKVLIKSNTVKVYTISFLYITIELLALFALGYNVNINSELKELLIPFIALIIGFQINMSEKHIKFLIYLYIVLMVFVGLSQIFMNIGGFVIEDQYLANAKNSLGALVAFATTLSYVIFLTNMSKVIKLVFLLLFILSIIILLTIRSRTAFVISFSLILFITYQYFSYLKKNLKLVFKIAIYFLIILILFLLFNNTIFDKIEQFLYNSFTAGAQGNDIFSGRLERNSEAINIISDSPFWGNLTLNKPIEWVHNYLLLKLSNYGIIGGLLWIFLYFYFIIIMIKSLFKYNSFNTYNWGIFPMLISFGISLAEPTFPYGPGTVSFIPFFMFGIFIKDSLILKK